MSEQMQFKMTKAQMAACLSHIVDWKRAYQEAHANADGTEARYLDQLMRAIETVEMCEKKAKEPTRAALPYEVTNLEDDSSHGRFATLEEARGCVRFDKLRKYEIYRDTVRVECCDPYEGDDDRVKQALGQPNASEHN